MSAVQARGRAGSLGAALLPWLMLSPILLVFLLIYLGGLAMVAMTSFDVLPGAGGSGPTARAYAEALTSPQIASIVWRTVRVSLFTVLFCFLLGFPVARYITSPSARWKSIVLMCVLSPLMVSAIGRIFGFIALFGPGSPIAQLMTSAFGSRSTGLLYTEPAMVIGLTNLLLPFMVLSIAASRAHLDPDIGRAAQSLGASPAAVFRQIEVPLSLPGILSGCLIVFSLSIGNFITAALLGGSGRNVIAYEVYLDTLVYFEPGRGAALSVLLLVVEVLLMLLAIRLSRLASRHMEAERPT